MDQSSERSTFSRLAPGGRSAAMHSSAGVPRMWQRPCVFVLPAGEEDYRTCGLVMSRVETTQIYPMRPRSQSARPRGRRPSTPARGGSAHPTRPRVSGGAVLRPEPKLTCVDNRGDGGNGYHTEERRSGDTPSKPHLLRFSASLCKTVVSVSSVSLPRSSRITLRRSSTQTSGGRIRTVRGYPTGEILRAIRRVRAMR